MSNYQSLFGSHGAATAENVAPPQVQQTHTPAAPPAPARLFPCPDCGRACSRHAESCPGCGRFFQRFAQEIVVDRSGWVSTIAFGVIWAAVLPWLIIIGIFVVLLITGGVLAGVSK